MNQSVANQRKQKKKKKLTLLHITYGPFLHPFCSRLKWRIHHFNLSFNFQEDAQKKFVNEIIRKYFYSIYTLIC
jgi:hypothetical protein